jgi:PadR family transcriptional regulator, regulatory protein PadR
MESDDRLGRFEEVVLRAMFSLGEKTYPVPLRRAIAELTSRDCSLGAVYTTLERLQKKGYVNSELGNPTPERGGRAKRYFWIEAPGKRALNNSRETFVRMGGLLHVG